jgi:hypothetical protein
MTSWLEPGGAGAYVPRMWRWAVLSALLACGARTEAPGDAAVPSDSAADDLAQTDSTSGGDGEAAADALDAGILSAPKIPALHRPASSACVTVRLPTDASVSFPPGSDCASDQDCTRGTSGRCDWEGGSPNRCTYDECESDNDCNGSGVGTCELSHGFRLRPRQLLLAEPCPRLRIKVLVRVLLPYASRSLRQRLGLL